jgi:hypothetical protein
MSTYEVDWFKENRPTLAEPGRPDDNINEEVRE